MVSVNFPPVTSARSMAPAPIPQRIVLVGQRERTGLAAACPTG